VQDQELPLEGPTQTLVCAFRWWLTAERDRDPSASNRARIELSRLLGAPRACVVLALFDVMVRAVARHAARTIRVHPPWCQATTPDEALLLSLAGACQAGEWRWCKAVVGILTTPEGEESVLAAANDLAQSLLNAGVALPRPCESCACPSLHSLRVVTLH
jgi:hypothetical protein